MKPGPAQYFQSARVRTPNGRRVGTVLAYQGDRWWLFYVLNRSYRDARFQEQIVRRAGTSLTLPPFRLVSGSWGIATPLPVRDVALVRLAALADGTIARHEGAAVMRRVRRSPRRSRAPEQQRFAVEVAGAVKAVA